MKKGMRSRMVLLGLLVVLAAGCKLFTGPDKTGEFRLSSERLNYPEYYTLGYHFEDSEFYKFPFEKDPLPDIINEGIRVLSGSSTIELPSFHTPGETNGFALAGEFESLDDARDFFKGYRKVEDGMQFEVISDTVKEFQVWIQKTSQGNYVKLLIREAESLVGEGDVKYSEVFVEYTYQPKGSTDFPD